MNQEKRYFRFAFVVFAAVSIAAILWNTYVFFNELKENERQKMEIWAAAQKELLQDSDLETDIGQLVIDIIISNTSTPMILYHHSEEEYDVRNFYDEELSLEDKKRFVEKFKTHYEPIDVIDEGEVISTIYYGNSDAIEKLKYYPAGIILIILLFAGLIYFFYRTQKNAEQNKVWAGMAKETAHQIGTPLSSLVGWTELLRSELVNPQYIKEMEKDIDRLQTITERFSKIGSMPNLERADVVKETISSFEYLKSRGSKLIQFHINTPSDPIYVKLNVQLYSWAIENLVKNAIDAMRGKGEVTVAIEKNTKNVKILVSDTGRGIPSKDHKKIFKPGFTTKKRGWGLGLSLTRRIIEDYHAGKIKVKQSAKDAGTTFQITLRIQE
ncbi:MAG TPA: HAMP domain-containing sensor histidine kinase [Flavobacteriaceae bacterium]|nr:HAMP domain-containing sensor histidine kinase [Flavobacteriaceae bacterium]